MLQFPGKGSCGFLWCFSCSVLVHNPAVLGPQGTRKVFHSLPIVSYLGLKNPKYSIMPALLQDQASPGLSEASSDAYFHSNVQIVEDSEYPAISFDGYSEKPLSQQLEPIAVVGMGMFQDVLPAMLL